MKEIRVITTVQLTDIVSFEDSPGLYDDIVNGMDEVRKDIIEEVRHQNSLADDVNVKVQFFVDDRDEAGSDKLAVKFRLKDCRYCKRRDECSSGDDMIVALKCQFGGFSFFMPADNANDND